MHYQQDWILRQIEMAAHFIAVTVFGKNIPAYELINEDTSASTDTLHKQILKHLENKDICKAEDILFEYIDAYEAPAAEIAGLALDFYTKINEYTDEELNSMDFSREEIMDGLREVMKRLDLPDTGL